MIRLNPENRSRVVIYSELHLSLSLPRWFWSGWPKHCAGDFDSKRMQESFIDDEQDSKSHGVSELITEPDNGVVKFDIGSFVLCHRKLCRLIEPFSKCYESFIFLTR